MSVAVSGLMDGMNYFFIISRSRLAAVNNKKILSRFHFYFFLKHGNRLSAGLLT